jgi:hypothetical protein
LSVEKPPVLEGTLRLSEIATEPSDVLGGQQPDTVAFIYALVRREKVVDPGKLPRERNHPAPWGQ